MITDNHFQKFEAELERLRQKWHIPGMSIAIARANKVIYAKGFGYADVENRISATEDTPYHIASLTKPFAAALIMQLVEAGQLDLDAPMAEILADAEFAYRGGTVRGFGEACKMIRETAEDESGPYAQYRFLFANYLCDSEHITVRHHLTHTAQGKPGHAYEYNGFLFGLLTQVIERAANQGFQELLVERIIEPLEMTRTFPSADKERQQQILTQRAKPFGWEGDDFVVTQYPEGVNAAAGMVSTVLDLAEFSIAMDQNALVSEASKATMFTSARSVHGRVLPYGLGWFVQEYKSHKLIWHYGWQPESYSSLILKVPEEELTLILLSNSDGASAHFNLGAGDVLKSPFARLFLDQFASSGGE